jgi:phosphate transport system permease protein
MLSVAANDSVARWFSRIMYCVCMAFAAAILSLLALITGYLISKGWNCVSLQFFTQLPGGDPKDPGGMRNAIEGTAILVGMASLVGIPVGMLAGIYLAEYNVGSRLATPVRFVADVLAGVPSIVVGILGYQLLVVPIGAYNGWAGSLALAFIMIPIVARTTEEMLLLVPNSYREASIALGATRARTILRVVVPSATGSVITGIMLAIARVGGETAPLLFTALTSQYIVRDLSRPFPSLTVQIFKDATHSYPEFQSRAWAGILVLISLIFVLNLTIRFITRGKRV